MGCCSTRLSKYTDADLAACAADGFTFHVLTKADEAEAVALGVLAFKGADGKSPEPSFAYCQGIVAPGDELPNTKALEYFWGDVATWVHRWLFLQAVTCGGVVVGCRDAATKKLVGYAVLFLPATLAMSQEGRMMKIACCEKGMGAIPSFDKKIFGEKAGPRNLAYEAVPKAKAIVEFKRPFAGKLWKLEVLATDPARQGTGVGRLLMNAVYALSDAERAPMIVECAGESLPSCYRKLGFTEGEATHELAVKDDPVTCKLTYLLRNKGAAPAAASSATVVP